MSALISTMRSTRVTITYLPGFNDGFGAQLQRLLALVAISRTYGFAYFHTPLTAIEYQGLRSLLDGHNSDEFVAECNKRGEEYQPCHLP